MPKIFPLTDRRRIYKLYDAGWGIDHIVNVMRSSTSDVRNCLKMRRNGESHVGNVESGNGKSKGAEGKNKDMNNMLKTKQEIESTTLGDKLDYTSNPKDERTKKQGLDAVTGGKGKGSVGTFYVHMLNQLKKLDLTPSQYLDKIAKQRGYDSAKELKEAMAAKKGCKPEELSEFIARELNYNSLTHALNHLAKYLGFHSQQHYADCTLHEKGEGSVVEHIEEFLEELTSKNGEKLEELLKEKGFEDFGEYVDYLSKITGYDLPKKLPQIL